MNKDELKTALVVIKEYLLRVKPRTYPLSKDYEWIESAVRIIFRDCAENIMGSGGDRG